MEQLHRAFIIIVTIYVQNLTRINELTEWGFWIPFLWAFLHPRFLSILCFTQTFVKLANFAFQAHLHLTLLVSWHKLVPAKLSKPGLRMVHSVLLLYSNPGSQKLCQIPKKHLKSCEGVVLFWFFFLVFVVGLLLCFFFTCLFLRKNVKCGVSLACLLVSLPSTFFFFFLKS